MKIQWIIEIVFGIDDFSSFSIEGENMDVDQALIAAKAKIKEDGEPVRIVGMAQVIGVENGKEKTTTDQSENNHQI